MARTMLGWGVYVRTYGNPKREVLARFADEIDATRYAESISGGARYGFDQYRVAVENRQRQVICRYKMGERI